VVDPPTSITDVILNFKVYIETFIGTALLVVFLSGFIVGLFKVEEKWVKQLLSMIIALLATVLVGPVLHLGFLKEAPWIEAVGYGVAIGLGSWGLFSWSLWEEILKVLFGYVNARKK